MASKQKSNFKVFCKTTGKYLSGHKSKGTWNTLKWAMSAAEDWLRRGYLNNEIEIHEFPLANPTVITLEEAQAALKEKAEAKLQSELKQRVERARALLLKEIEVHKENLMRAERELSKLQK